MPSTSSQGEVGPQGDEKRKRKRGSNRSVRVHPYGDPFIDNSPHPDIVAMSVLSLYEKENEQSCSEMDTDRCVILWLFY